jgi:glycosyltransferase involved in cell wall biosynthesis
VRRRATSGPLKSLWRRAAALKVGLLGRLSTASDYDRGVRIMHVEAGRHLYGGARQVGELIGGLAARGVASTLVCPPDQPLAGSLPAADVIRLPIGGELDVALWARLRRQIAHVKPDLVHVHSRRGADWYGGWAARFERCPAVLTRRVDAPEASPIARLKYRPYRFVVAISRCVESQLRAVLGDSARLRTIPSAVDTRRFRPDASARGRVVGEFDLPAAAPIVGIAAQLIARKGHRHLFDCLPELIRRRGDLSVLCFGRGPLERRLKRHVASLGLGAHVRFVGFRDDLPDLLPGVDLLVHPAQREGLGLVLLEAMSCAVPIVAAPSGGIVDVVDSGTEGLLVPLDDPRGWVRAIDELLADPARRARMGAAGRARVEREHTVERMASRYLDLYRSACAA